MGDLVRRLITHVTAVSVALGLASAGPGAALGMLMGEAGKATIVHSGSLEFRVVNRLDANEISHFVVFTENKDGSELKLGSEYRTEKDVYHVEPKSFVIPEIRFKPGNERRSIRVCIRSTDAEGNPPASGYIIRMCSRAVVFMGRGN